MTPSTSPRSSGVCPQEGCTAPAVVATDSEAAHGMDIWSCTAGHHGPRFFRDGDAV